MPNSDRLSAPKTPSAPFLTLQISRGAAWMFLAVFAAAAAALLLPRLRDQSTTSAAAPTSAQEALYAAQNRLVSAAVRNSSGNFVNAAPQSLTEAAATADIPADFRASITNAPGRNAYPIASFTWLLVPQKSSDPVKANDLTAFLRWTLDQGQQQTEALGYGRLPKSLTDQLTQLLAPETNKRHP